MVLNPARATTMLLSNVDKIPVNLVVSKLKKKKHLLYEVSLSIFNKLTDFFGKYVEEAFL